MANLIKVRWLTGIIDSRSSKQVLTIIYEPLFEKELRFQTGRGFLNAPRETQKTIDEVCNYVVCLDSFLRRLIRMCIRKVWRLPKTRIRNLIKCGINAYNACKWVVVRAIGE